MLIKFLQLTKILSSPSVNKLHQNWWNIEISSYFLLLIKPLLCYVQGLPYASLGCCQERMSYDALIEKTTKKVQRTWSCADTKKTIDLLELKKYQLKSIDEKLILFLCIISMLMTSIWYSVVLISYCVPNFNYMPPYLFFNDLASNN